MEATTLQLIWFGLIGVLLAGYAILDGFDLGVGILHLGARDDTERRVFMNSIGPLWDGNEVWLVVFGGALFSAFPRAYAAAFSGFYLAFMLLLCCLIFRGVSMEFRSKHDAPRWRRAWDVAFCLSSAVATFLLGVLVGNCLQGLPLGADGDFTRGLTVPDLLNAYSILTGLFAVYTFAMHGSIYLYLKTEGELFDKALAWGRRAMPVMGLSLFAISISTPLVSETIADAWFSLPNFIGLLPIPLATIVAFARVRTVAAVLLLPYLAWTTFATLLNLDIARRNRHP